MVSAHLAYSGLIVSPRVCFSRWLPSVVVALGVSKCEAASFGCADTLRGSFVLLGWALLGKPRLNQLDLFGSAGVTDDCREEHQQCFMIR